MDWTVIGGDQRSVFLVRRLLQDGHRVRCWGLEQADLPDTCHALSLEDALYHTDSVVLPIPATQGNDLRMPYASRKLSVQELADVLPEHVPIYVGAPGAELTARCQKRSIPLTDLLSVEALTAKNAALTAECAVGLLIQKLPYALQGEPVLILGAGRIGRRLGMLLQGLGAEVTIAARKPVDRIWCGDNGLAGANLYGLQPLLPQFRLVINTIPARVLNHSLLGSVPRDAVLMELASKPGGFDPQVATMRGLQVISAGGLPGRFAPESAAAAIAETIYSIIGR